MTRIDLHVRSTMSDGAAEPGEVMARAHQAGVDVISLTDLNSMSGLADAASALPPGMTLIPGVAISCYVSDGERQRVMCLLAYLPDPTSRDLTGMLHTITEGRRNRPREIVALLAADGHRITWPDVAARAGRGQPNLRHIADALVAAGLVATRQDAYTPAWLAAGSDYWRPAVQPGAAEAIRVVRGAGGVPVLAYPRGGRGPTLTDTMITDLVGRGLAGIEVDRPDAGPARRAHLRTLAHQHGLIATGGSGYRGGRRSAQLGAATTTTQMYTRIAHAARGATPITSR